MKLSRIELITLITVIVLGASLSALGLLGQTPFLLLFSILLAAIWCATIVFGKPDLDLVFFVAFLALISIGIFNRMPFVWLTLTVCLDIAAWNLAEFNRRLQKYEHIHNARKLENQHLKQLGIPLGIGFALSILPSFVKMEISFLAMVILVIGAVVLVGLGIRGLQEKVEE